MDFFRDMWENKGYENQGDWFNSAIDWFNPTHQRNKPNPTWDYEQGTTGNVEGMPGESVYEGQDPEWFANATKKKNLPLFFGGGGGESKKKFNWAGMAEGIGEGLMGSAMQNEEYMYDLY